MNESGLSTRARASRSPIAAFSALSSLAIAQQAADAGANASEIAQQAPNAEADSSLRLEARLEPVIAVDASGQARLDVDVGTANDRFTAEVEIAKADFAELGITRGNSFRDEVVELRVSLAACRFLAIVSSSPEIL